MALILIDGYNLIGTAHGNLEKARSALIKDLQDYIKVKGHEVTLVFDGWKDGQKDETRIKTGSLTIIYSRLGETADSVIKKIVNNETTPWIVVSSDRDVSEHATRKECAAVSSEEFDEKLSSALNNLRKDINNDDTTYHNNEIKYRRPSRSKVNPRKLSKKQKKKIQALLKL
jgi:predicted RNA-binding protein with PIN domain